MHTNRNGLFLYTYLRILLWKVPLPLVKTPRNIHSLIKHVFFLRCVHSRLISSSHDFDTSICHLFNFILCKRELLSRSPIVIKRRIKPLRFPVGIRITIVFVNFLTWSIIRAIWSLLFCYNCDLLPWWFLIYTTFSYDIGIASIDINVADISASLDSLNGCHLIRI